MGVLFGMSIFGLFIALFVLAVIERFSGRLPWRRRSTPGSTASFDQVHALFYATKHYELEQRQTEEMLRDDAEDGDGDRPRRLRFDLDG